MRVTHNVAATILETISDRHIDLLCMGWQGKTATSGKIFGSTVDTAIRQAPCHVMLVKLGEQLQANNLPASESSAPEAMIRLTRLHRWLLGSIPTAIARGSDCTVIVVRTAITDRV